MRRSHGTDTSSRYLCLAVFALSALVCQDGSAATPLGFRPGAANPCVLDVNRMDGSMSLADIDQYENVQQFDSAVLNNSPAASTGLPDDRTITFDISGGSVTGSTTFFPGATAPAGSLVVMQFRMHLLSANGASGPKQYGIDNVAGRIFSDNSRTTLNPAFIRFPTHVYVEAKITGSLGSSLNVSSANSAQAHSLTPAGRVVFTKAEFRMFFDVDGDPATTGDRALVAKFGIAAAPNPLSSFAGTTFVGQEVVNFLVNWDSALPGVFADASGHELAIGPADPSDTALRQISPAAASISTAEIGFRFECALTGPCFTVTNNTLSFRLHTHNSGFMTISGLPASTQLPAALCPQKLKLPDFGDSVCFPRVFCELPYFWVIVLILSVILAGVVAVYAIRKYSQRAK